jgi:hypothetical protein
MNPFSKVSLVRAIPLPEPYDPKDRSFLIAKKPVTRRITFRPTSVKTRPRQLSAHRKKSKNNSKVASRRVQRHVSEQESMLKCMSIVSVRRQLITYDPRAYAFFNENRYRFIGLPAPRKMT